ncbi:MAG: hypothetical protein VW989_10150, partial [Rhodobiaceae bacterium]
MARQQVTRSGAPLAGLLVSGFVLVSGAFVGGAALAQQYSASQSAGQTSGQTTGQVDLLSTVQDNGGQGTDLPSPTISSIDEAIEVISGGADKDGATASSMEDAASLTDNATGNGTGTAPVIIAVSPPVADNAAGTSTGTSTGTAMTSSGSVSLNKA